jgi:hypothetical protein
MIRNWGRRHPHAQLNSEIPLRQYFLFVGSALLMLLFVANWLMPLPALNERINSELKLPTIRIHSALKGPEAVVIEASRSTIGPVPAAPEVIVAPQTATAVGSPQNRAFAYPDALLPRQADANEPRKKEERQKQTGRRVVATRLVRRPILTHRQDPTHVEPQFTRSIDSRLEFRETFAQLAPRSSKQPEREETTHPDISGLQAGVKTQSLPNLLGCKYRRPSPCMRTSPSLFNERTVDSACCSFSKATF